MIMRYPFMRGLPARLASSALTTRSAPVRGVGRFRGQRGHFHNGRRQQASYFLVTLFTSVLTYLMCSPLMDA